MPEIQKFTLILFKLPDGRIVLQRRTQDAPYGAGLLGIFGGWVEANETVDKCLLREIEEETSLDITKLRPILITDFIIKSSKDFDQDRHFYLYEALIDSMGYEGDGAEAFTLDQIKQRKDLTGSAQFTFKEVL
jgi:8-oxo-dGTP pyrophosphatase MutT (NUDIX family)